jgi:sphingolipid delta-4 desaturase
MGKGAASGEQEAMPTDFFFRYTDEPHATRRKQILAKYPEIETLYGPDIRPLPVVLAIIASQLYLSYLSVNWSWPVFLLVAWIYGGASSHALSLMTHELSHNLMFKTPIYNSWFGIVCNIGMGIPSSTMFKRYHLEHHQYQGDTEKDMDLPTPWEGHFFTNTMLKALWLLLQPLFYSLRPTIVRPKKPMKLDILNTVTIICTDAILAYFISPWAVFYLVVSTLLGMGFHPVAGHFIAEHYVFVEGHETYSYYGALNYLCWNVGYHNEHHDFPKVAGWRLPEVKKMAPEFYDNLPQHKSWTMVLFNYVTDPRIGPFSRMIKKSKKQD